MNWFHKETVLVVFIAKVTICSVCHVASWHPGQVWKPDQVQARDFMFISNVTFEYGTVS